MFNVQSKTNWKSLSLVYCTNQTKTLMEKLKRKRAYLIEVFKMISLKGFIPWRSPPCEMWLFLSLNMIAYMDAYTGALVEAEEKPVLHWVTATFLHRQNSYTMECPGWRLSRKDRLPNTCQLQIGRSAIVLIGLMISGGWASHTLMKPQLI